MIRAPAGGAAEMLAQELCNSLRENIATRGPAHALFAGMYVCMYVYACMYICMEHHHST